jgi:hypothetical protein
MYINTGRGGPNPRLIALDKNSGIRPYSATEG